MSIRTKILLVEDEASLSEPLAYLLEKEGFEVAKLGVLGPTRMHYSENIAAVRAVARYLTQTLGGL